ncbi:MAG: hypothetical protein J2P37_03205 [Ktedonobacteraceae bacterium]|nr:hypothetical protein [Ktedonobacteraceae bacterium]MBO0792100.1 hypothetical protein [Ktedonobacteraceae bacterium]
MSNNSSATRETADDEQPPSNSDIAAATAETPAKEHTASTTLMPHLSAFIETGLIVVGLLATFFLLPRTLGNDGALRYKDLVALLSHQAADSKYSLIGPIFSLPLLLIGRKLGHPEDWIRVYNQVLFALSLLINYFVLRNHIDRGLLRKFFLLLIVASMFVAHLAFFYGEVFTALCAGFGILAIYLRFAAPAGWLALVLGVANTPATLAGLGLMALKRVIDNRRFRYLLVIIAAAALIALESWLRRGNPLGSGYADDHGFPTIMPYSGRPGFSYPLFFGVLSLLFSFGKGLLFFAPGLLLPVRKTLLKWHPQGSRIPLDRVYILWLCFLVGLIFIYAQWWAWYGGPFWGPRFLLFASIPASFALATRLHYRDAGLPVNLLTLGIFVLSVWVCIDGSIYQWATSPRQIPLCVGNNYNLEMICYYTPEFSPLWLPFVKHYSLSIQQILYLAYILISAAYLITPLAIQIVQQIRALVRKYGKDYLKAGTWRI